jgi:polyisoprenyl-phosphate glycosyltransferase
MWLLEPPRLPSSRVTERPRYSFVVPVFNEEETLPELERRVTAVIDALDGPAEVILVDDGSTDRTSDLAADLNRRDPRFKLLRFTRNFGHQMAITAGLDHAQGDAVVIMDGDLQDPPEIVPELIARWREGYEVVYAIRQDRSAEPWWRRTAIAVFYRTLRRLVDVDIPLDAGDFRLVDRRALDQFRRMRENNRYVRGLFAWIGFRQIGVPYKRGERYAGQTKYPLGKLIKLGADGIVGFSNLPLRAAMALGFLVAGTSFVIGLVAIALRIAHVGAVPGWASIVVVVSFLGGVQLIVMGTVGIYVARIYEEVKGRPLYILRDATGFADDPRLELSELAERRV